MTSRTIDPRSTASAALAVAEQTDLLVIGAGPAGLAAAIAGARHGLAVVLVDENPVPAETMGDDVPLHFGQRMTGAARNRTAMTEALIATEPALAEAFEAGVDVRLSTIAWGLYANGPSVGWLPGTVAGLADGERSWMIGFKAAIVATGRRDMGLAFPGWQLPGVMGATAAERLAARYQALGARRAVVLGSTAEALAAALAMRAAGVAIVAIVEQANAHVGPAAPLAELVAAGVPVLAGHVIVEALGDAEGVRGAVLAPLGPHGRGAAFTLDCDTIVIGIAAVPVIELLDAVGTRVAFVAERGGHVPAVGLAQQTSVRGIYAVGDCAGVWAGKTLDRSIAEAEGLRAAAHAANATLPDDMDQPEDPEPGAPTYDLGAYRLAWVRHAVVEAHVGPGAEAHVCQCEEVTARDILELRPPRYLGWTAPPRNDPDLTALLGNGPPNPDQVKRLTRAGMGLCQGRRCREQVAALLALGGHVTLAEVPLATHRAPVRPLPLGLAGTLPESAEMAANWEIWFGIRDHVRPYWTIAPGEITGDAAALQTGADHG